jgi:hypothetical protein
VLFYNQIGISLLRYQPNYSLPGWAIPYPVTITPCLHGMGVAQCNPSPLSSTQHHASRLLNKTKATEPLNLRSASKQGIRGSCQGCGETCTAPYMPCRCDVPATRPFEHPGSVARWRWHGNPLHVGRCSIQFAKFDILPHLSTLIRSTVGIATLQPPSRDPHPIHVFVNPLIRQKRHSDPKRQIYRPKRMPGHVLSTVSSGGGGFRPHRLLPSSSLQLPYHY